MTEGPWASPREPDPAAEAPREPAFNIPLANAWGLLVILAGIAVGYLWQIVGGVEADHAGALSINAIATGRWQTLLTSMFMHGGLLHLVMNLSALLPFGLILARRMGPGGGQLRFIAFYLASGLAAAFAWLAIGAGQGGAMVGASGAIFGLWGAVIRLSRRGQVLPLFSREVATQLPGPIIANVLVALAFGAAAAADGSVAGIAWEAHLGGFVFGLLTAGLFLPRRQP